ncbi:polyketide synthase [Mycobacterium sp. 852002-50816_SCH5313054-b]|uniref:type I polyketide synthase n=1 Tax=Mycobacterium sp. 852002-50816_SCH5313054-b TaxID=1834092 RepID=UPI0007FBFCB8|nr:type I polyketide synthase [Mycobacterium sp. 852002-50816_SCH5313054-b]OBF44772.1 polyketide synthase [Mycobacterium sp. 852002-50816_SCH5313054-b]
MPPTAIAVIGLACRLPGAGSPDGFWRLIRDGAEASALPGDVAEFDANFFNVSPREAAAMDPRQRLALELAWEALEDAFVLPETLRGERVAVYLGAMNDDYGVLTLAQEIDHHSFAGVSRTMIANRVSYALGLQGPSLTVDSGQSSSLVAVHLACESIRTGESELALAGGVHLNLAGETASLETEFGALSPTGHTYAFDARADGYVRSEGGGLVLLKPLRAALADGDPIRAVIRGSAVANAGHSAAAPTVPSVRGEVDVVRRALRTAGLDAGQLQYIEAHGTGTEIGDSVEATALGEVFAGPRRHPLGLGSVKTNIGHAGAAAGIAGLIKTVLAVENAAIPPSLNYAAPGPGFDPESLGLRVNATLTPWPEDAEPRRAGVSSFGMGGTNAHVLVEQAPARVKSEARDRGDAPTAWVLSGRSERALANQAARLLTHVTADAALEVGDVGWSLATTRSVFEHRAVLVGADRAALTSGLAGLADGQARPDVAVGRARAPGKTAFVFPGQGAQSLAMGTRLYGRFPAFARAFDEAAAALDDHLRLPLRDVMWGGDAKLLDNTEFAQPALFAIERALAELLRDWGIVADVALGHSVGEITAAHLAGVLSLADAAKVVAARGRLMAGLPDGGVMIAVAAGEADVTPLLTDGLAIAAVNGPDAVVISGAHAAAAAVADTLARQGRRVHRLTVSHAFHSPLMEPMIDDFAAVVADVSPAEPRIALVSNVSGQLAGPGYGSAHYWVEHVRRPVRFADGVRAAESYGADVFVEVGPGGGLGAAVEHSVTTDHPVSVTTLAAKDRPEVESLLTAAGRLFTAGVAVRWGAVLRGGQRVPLPTYGFARQRFWLGDRTDTPSPVASRPAELAERLRPLPDHEQRRELVALVCGHAAAVLGHADLHAVDAERAFQDLGFDSLTGVELRNRVKADTGLALSRTLVFDYPNPAALADHLAQQLLHGEHEKSNDEKIWSVLKNIPIHELRRTGLLDKLLALAGDPENPCAPSTMAEDAIDSLSPEALIALALDADEAGEVQ